MTEQTQPTDAELEAAWTDATGSSILPYPGEMLAFARAVLAKWGTPAGAGEVAYLHDDGYWTPAKTEAGRQLNDRLMCAGSPKVAVYLTPQPTQAQAGAEPNWQDIATAPKDGTRFVAVGYNYGIYGETQHTCIAQWFRGCWMEASDWNETSELKYLTHWMPLLPLPGSAEMCAQQPVGQLGMALLTDEELCQIEEPHLVNFRIPLGGQYDFARAAETAVLAKTRGMQAHTPAAQEQAGAVPLTRKQVKAILTECGYDGASAQHRADFINGLRNGEAAHGIKGADHG